MPSGRQDNLGARIAVSAALSLALIGAGIAVFMVHLKLRERPSEKKPGKPHIAVRVEVATRGSTLEFLSGYGAARALRQAVVSAEVAGVVENLSRELEAGVAVEKDDELVFLESSDYDSLEKSAGARKRQADAAVVWLESDRSILAERLEIAREDFEAAKREHTRVEGLTRTGVLPGSDLDRQRITKSLSEKEVLRLEAQRVATEQDLARARAEVTATEAALEMASLDTLRTVVKAPYAGVIEARLVEKGARVAPGTALFKIVDPTRVEIAVAIGASSFGEVARGAEATVWLAGSEKPVWTGKVARISPSVNTTDRTFMVYLVVAGGDGPAPVPPGAFVRARIEGWKHENVIAVPRSAFVGDDLYVARPEGGGEAVVTRRAPRVRRLLPEVALVEAGLEPGELVIVTNLEQIADKARVLIVTDETAGETGRRTDGSDGR